MKPDSSTQFFAQIISTNDIIRSENLEAKLTELGLGFQISPGIVPNENDFHGGVLHSKSISKLILQRNLLIGEVGCALAHRNAMTNFLSSDKEFGLIFEDDAEVVSEFNLDILIDCLDSELPITIVLGWIPGYAISRDPQIPLSEDLIELITPPTCTFAYAINRAAAKLIIGASDKIMDVADWPIHVLSKMFFYAIYTPWIDTKGDENISTIGERFSTITNHPLSVLASRIMRVGSLATLILLSKSNRLDISPKQIVHALVIRPMLYEYGTSQVGNDSNKNQVIPLSAKYKKFGLVPSRWTRV